VEGADVTQPHPIKFPPQEVLNFLVDAAAPWLNAMRAVHGIEPEPPRIGPPVSVEEARQAWDEYQAWEALRFGKSEHGTVPDSDLQPELGRQREPRRPTLASVAKAARTAGIEVARYEIKSDSINVITGKGEPAAPENPWLAELHRKETKR
jgi:hypothetical protein